MAKLVGFWNEGAAQLLHNRLVEKGLRVEDFAELVEVDPRSVRYWTRTEKPPKHPSVENFLRIREVLGTSVEEFEAAAREYEQARLVDSQDRSDLVDALPLNFRALRLESTTDSLTAAPSAGTPRRPRRLKSISVGLAGVVTLVVLISLVAKQKGFFGAGRMPRFNLTIPAETDSYYAAYGARISPDGTRVAFLAREPKANKRFIFIRAMNRDDAAPIRDSEGEYTPFFWSADGRSVFFVRDRWLSRAPVETLIPERIAEVGDATRGSESARGIVLLGSTRGIVKVTLSDRRASMVTRVRKIAGESAHLSPYLLPDGNTFLFLTIAHSASGDVTRTLCAGRIDEPDALRVLGPLPSRAEFNARRLLYVRDGTLFARPFDEKRLEFTGEETTVTGHVWYTSETGDADFSAAQNGALVVKDVPPPSRLQIVHGGHATDIAWNGDVRGLSLASKRNIAVLAVALTPGRPDLWFWDLDTDVRKQLTFFGTNTSPVVTSSGDIVFFAADRKSFGNIYMVPTTGAGTESPVFVAAGIQAPRGITSDDRYLLFQWFRNLDGDIYSLDLKSRNLTPFAATPVMEGETARFSPDGTWVVYTSAQSGDGRVYVAAYPPQAGEPIPISPGLGWRARWSRDGSTIYYAAGRTVMAYDFKAKKLIGETYRADADITQLEMTADGGFLMVIGGVEPPNRIISDWQDAASRTAR